VSEPTVEKKLRRIEKLVKLIDNDTDTDRYLLS